MDKEQKAMFSDMGKQAAYLYNGAFEVFQNSKQAEKIVFITVTTITIGFALTGCDAEATDNIDIGVYEWIDPDTQVHYIYNGAGGVSVRYNADGTIMHD